MSLSSACGQDWDVRSRESKGCRSNFGGATGMSWMLDVLRLAGSGGRLGSRDAWEVWQAWVGVVSRGRGSRRGSRRVGMSV